MPVIYHFALEGRPFVQKQAAYSRGHFYNPCNKEIKQVREQICEIYPTRQILDEPIQVRMTFFMPIPQYILTACKTGRYCLNQDFLPVKRPDIDNIAYLYTNSMKSLLYKDDSLICNMQLSKRYGVNPQTVIQVSTISDDCVFRNGEDGEFNPFFIM